MTPEFDRRASLVLDSEYWNWDTEDIAEYRRFSKEFKTLRAAIQKADSYNDLKGEAKAIWDRAKAVLDEEDAAQEELDKMIAANDPRVMEGYERFYSTEADVGTIVGETDDERQ